MRSDYLNENSSLTGTYVKKLKKITENYTKSWFGWFSGKITANDMSGKNTEKTQELQIIEHCEKME